MGIDCLREREESQSQNHKAKEMDNRADKYANKESHREEYELALELTAEAALRQADRKPFLAHQ